MVAPASMRALLAARLGGERRDVRRPALGLADRFLGDEEWLAARTATCGASVTAITWTPLGEARQALADGVGDGGSRSPSMRAYCWDRIHLTKASASSGETFA